MITQRPAEWDRTVDVVVMGAGAGGLSAAVLAHDGGAEVLVLEKSSLLGGTAGVSGGIAWVPCNDHMAAAGIADSRDDALAYIRRLTQGREPDPALVEVYVDRAKEAWATLEATTPLRMMISAPFTDYHADFPGGRPEGGRSLEPEPYDARTGLGEWAARVRTSPHMPRLTMDEGAKSLFGGAVPIELAHERERDDIRVIGSGLVSPLVEALVERDVEFALGTVGHELVVVDGEVLGIRVEGEDGSKLIGARRGVVLASGGFEWNPEMVAAFVGRPLHPLTPPFNTGDGIRMVLEAGGHVANMSSYWGQPAVVDPNVMYEGRVLTQMGSARCMPGVIVVNRNGERFVNEGCSYQSFPKTVDAFDTTTADYPNEDHWMVWDQRIKDTAMILPTILPGEPAPDFVVQAPTLRELGEKMGIDAEGLVAAVARFNAHVAAGEDPDCGRGTTWFEGYQTGGPTAADVLVGVEQAPFYALRMVQGTIGTNGGPLVTEDAQVRAWDGIPIGGLYAAGNVTASVFGTTYPGGGATLGPAVTFGYLAGSHVAAQPARDLSREPALSA